MRFISLANSVPENNRSIFVLYEDFSGNLSSKFYDYDGYLTYDKDIKGAIYWTYSENLDKLKKD